MILKDKTAESFDIKFSKIKFWVELQILLKYIKNTSLSFPVFAMNHLILIWVGFFDDENRAEDSPSDVIMH